MALGKGLQAAGHAVTLCTSSSFESLVVDHGLAYGYMTDALIELMDSAQGRDALENASSLAGGIKTYARLIKEAGPIQRQMVRDSWASAQRARPDLIVYHPKAYWGPHFADRLGIPVVFAPLAPMFVPTADWPESATATGFWFLDSERDWQPPQDLQTFLDAGAPPVYVGFGSMAGRDPGRLSRIVVEALQQAGVRGVLATGWGGP